MNPNPLAHIQVVIHMLLAYFDAVGFLLRTYTCIHLQRIYTHVYIHRCILSTCTHPSCDTYVYWVTLVSCFLHTRRCIRLQMHTFTCIPSNISIHVFVSICNLAGVYKVSI